MLFLRKRHPNNLVEITSEGLGRIEDIHNEAFKDFTSKSGFLITDVPETDKDAVFVARINDNPVGFIAVRKAIPDLMYSTGIIERDLKDLVLSGKVPIYSITQLAVKKDFRGKGVGLKLLRNTLEESKGVLLSYITVQPYKNWASFSLYKKMGFKIIGFHHAEEYKGLRDFKSALVYNYNL